MSSNMNVNSNPSSPSLLDIVSAEIKEGTGKKKMSMDQLLQDRFTRDTLDLSDQGSPASAAISKLMSNTAALDMLDLEARAAVDATKDSQKMRKEGLKMRRHAHKEEIHQMKRGAEKLREMADAKVGQAVISALATVASAAANGSGDCSAKSIATALEVLDKVNPFGLELGYLQAEQAEIKTRQEEASQEAKSADEDVSEGKRLQESMTNLMQKVLDARHAARTAAIKG